MLWRAFVHLWPEKKPEVDPVLPSQLDDWDAEFTRLTGKTIWQARCEADPNLCKSAMMPGMTQNNPNPFYNMLQLTAQSDQEPFTAAKLQQALVRQELDQLARQQYMREQDKLHGLLGGLGNSLGGLFH